MNQLVCFYTNIIDYQSVILNTPLLLRDVYLITRERTKN